MSPIEVSHQNLSILKGKVICTREFFRYPFLDALVNQGTVTRMNIDSELAQLRMMRSGRCDYAYINEWIANFHNNSQDDVAIYASQTNFDISDGVLAFYPSWRRQINKFNQFTAKLEARGELKVILNKHLR